MYWLVFHLTKLSSIISSGQDGSNIATSLVSAEQVPLHPRYLCDESPPRSPGEPSSGSAFLSEKAPGKPQPRFYMSILLKAARQATSGLHHTTWGLLNRPI